MTKPVNQPETNPNAETDLLSAYIDRELSNDEYARITQRLQREPALAAELDELRTTVTLLRELPSLNVPRSFTLDPAQVQPQRPFWLRWRWAWGSGATVLAVLVLVVVVYSAGGAAPVAQVAPMAAEGGQLETVGGTVDYGLAPGLTPTPLATPPIESADDTLSVAEAPTDAQPEAAPEHPEQPMAMEAAPAEREAAGTGEADEEEASSGAGAGDNAGAPPPMADEAGAGAGDGAAPGAPSRPAQPAPPTPTPPLPADHATDADSEADNTEAVAEAENPDVPAATLTFVATTPGRSAPRPEGDTAAGSDNSSDDIPADAPAQVATPQNTDSSSPGTRELQTNPPEPASGAEQEQGQIAPPLPDLVLVFLIVVIIAALGAGLWYTRKHKDT